MVLAIKETWPFSPPKRATCSFHMIQGIKKRSVLDEIDFIPSIHVLQRATSETEFRIAANLLYKETMKKVAPHSDQSKALESFFSTWVDSDLFGWYSGFYDGPDTNNGVERCNNSLKDWVPRKINLSKLMLQLARFLHMRSVDPDLQVCF